MNLMLLTGKNYSFIHYTYVSIGKVLVIKFSFSDEWRTDSWIRANLMQTNVEYSTYDTLPKKKIIMPIAWQIILYKNQSSIYWNNTVLAINGI